ncbi:hypothetical protein NL676_017123 [Syzygium grande]|nr:hypothetical protein NL676_017123 [Syzygium grande]
MRRFLDVNSARLMVSHTITLAEHHTACQGDEPLIQAELRREHPIVSSPSRVASRNPVEPHRRPVIHSIGVPSPSRTNCHLTHCHRAPQVPSVVQIRKRYLCNISN